MGPDYDELLPCKVAIQRKLGLPTPLRENSEWSNLQLNNIPRKRLALLSAHHVKLNDHCLLRDVQSRRFHAVAHVPYTAPLKEAGDVRWFSRLLCWVNLGVSTYVEVYLQDDEAEYDPLRKSSTNTLCITK